MNGEQTATLQGFAQQRDALTQEIGALSGVRDRLHEEIGLLNSSNAVMTDSVLKNTQETEAFQTFVDKAKVDSDALVASYGVAINEQKSHLGTLQQVSDTTAAFIANTTAGIESVGHQIDTINEQVNQTTNILTTSTQDFNLSLRQLREDLIPAIKDLSSVIDTVSNKIAWNQTKESELNAREQLIRTKEDEIAKAYQKMQQDTAIPTN